MSRSTVLRLIVVSLPALALLRCSSGPGACMTNGDCGTNLQCVAGACVPATDAGTDAGLDAGRTDAGQNDGGVDAGPTDSTCTNPTALQLTDGGFSVAGTLVGRPQQATIPTCYQDSFPKLMPHFIGPAVYRLSVPAGATVRLTLHTGTAWDAALMVMKTATCAGDCFGVGDDLCGSTTGDEAVVFRNGPQAIDLFVLVQGWPAAESTAAGCTSASDPGAFVLSGSIDTSPPARGDLCTNPLSIAGVCAVIPGTLEGSLNDQVLDPLNCPGLYDQAGRYDFPDVFYSVTVPPMSTLNASVSPRNDAWDGLIYAIDPVQCMDPAAMCLAAADLHPIDMNDMMATESLSYANTTNASIGLVLGVSGWVGALSTMTDYSLNISFTDSDGGSSCASDAGTPADGGSGSDGGTGLDAGPGLDGGMDGGDVDAG